VPVYFYVTRNSSFYDFGNPIPFDLARVNEGNAMDLTTGKFTAPRPGIYFFSFTGHAYMKSSNPVSLGSCLYLNGNLIGSSFLVEEYGPISRYSPVTLQSTLNLKTGDQVWVDITYFLSGATPINLYDNSYNHWTHFTGFMLEEEIGASL
jgi:hypothetical protein